MNAGFRSGEQRVVSSAAAALENDTTAMSDTSILAIRFIKCCVLPVPGGPKMAVAVILHLRFFAACSKEGDRMATGHLVRRRKLLFRDPRIGIDVERVIGLLLLILPGHGREGVPH